MEQMQYYIFFLWSDDFPSLGRSSALPSVMNQTKVTGKLQLTFLQRRNIFILLFTFLIVCIFSMLHMLLIALLSPVLSNDSLKWQILLPLSPASKKLPIFANMRLNFVTLSDLCSRYLF